jgi:hypothetical protein
MTEKQVQHKFTELFKEKGAYYMKNDANYRTGVPDWSFWHPDLSGLVEFKAHYDSAYRPLQKATIKKLQAMGLFCQIIHSENCDEWLTKLDLWLEPVVQEGKLE